MDIRLDPELEAFLSALYKAEKEHPERNYFDANDFEGDQAKRVRNIQSLAEFGFTEDVSELIPFHGRTVGPRYVIITELGRAYCKKYDL